MWLCHQTRPGGPARAIPETSGIKKRSRGLQQPRRGPVGSEEPGGAGHRRPRTHTPAGHTLPQGTAGEAAALGPPPTPHPPCRDSRTNRLDPARPALPPPVPGTLRERARTGSPGETTASPLRLSGSVAIPQASLAVATAPGRAPPPMAGGCSSQRACVCVGGDGDGATTGPAPPAHLPAGGAAAAPPQAQPSPPAAPIAPAGGSATGPAPRPFRRRSLATATRRGRGFRGGGSGEGAWSSVAKETRGGPAPRASRGGVCAARRGRRPSCPPDGDGWGVGRCSGPAAAAAQALGSRAAREEWCGRCLARPGPGAGPEGWYSLRAPRRAVASPALFRPPSHAASLTGGP